MTRRGPPKGIPLGFTLIEIMVSTTLLTLLMAAAGTVMVTGARMAHQQDLMADARSGSLLAERSLTLSLRSAGLGTPNGINIGVTGVVVRVNPIHTVDSTVGTDELYVIAPDPNGTLDDCSLAAASAHIDSLTGGLVLSCATSIQTGASVVIYDPATGRGALLTQVVMAGMARTTSTDAALGSGSNVWNLDGNFTLGGPRVAPASAGPRGFGSPGPFPHGRHHQRRVTERRLRPRHAHPGARQWQHRPALRAL